MKDRVYIQTGKPKKIASIDHFNRGCGDDAKGMWPFDAVSRVQDVADMSLTDHGNHRPYGYRGNMPPAVFRRQAKAT